MGKGKLWGQWLKQESLTKEIVSLRDSNVIVISYQRAAKMISENPRLIENRYVALYINLYKIAKCLTSSPL